MTTIHRLSNEQYAMLFDENSKVELIDGIVYDKMNVGDAHIRTVNRLNQLLSPLWGKYVISVQNPIKWKDNEPEPDVAIYLPCDRQTPEDCILVIEVADSTLHHDRTVKVPAYLSQGLTAWIVNLPENKIEIYRPGEQRQDVSKVEILGIEIDVNDLG
ncbi:MAG: Uma2 family endonuclease [bacterium]|nr:Uma2 family endonuclease [bacterium]